MRTAHAGVEAGGTSSSPQAAPLAAAASPASCDETTVTAPVQADSWVDENSPLASKGSDSILSVDGGSLNSDTGQASGRARALVRFALPPAIPAGCVVESARLRLFSSEESAGARAEVVRLASAWSEGSVSWSNHPQTAGAGVASWSRSGYMQWNVTVQVEAMLAGGNHGFLVRDVAEASAEGGGGHGFYSKEKGENPAELVIRFAPPPSEQPPDGPAPPVAAAVACGQMLTASTLVTNDLLECPGDGLVVGAPRIVVDLGGHVIDGVGLGSGVRNDGHASVTVRNGTVRQFDYGVNLLPETELNLVESLLLQGNEVGAVELFDVASTIVRGNVLDENGGGISLVSGTTGTLVTGNTVRANGKAGLFVRDSDGNRLEGNSVSGGGDLGIGLERARGNVLVGNTLSDNSDGAIEVRDGSDGTVVERNTVRASGDHGILVDDSDRNEVVENIAHLMSDSGITLEGADDGVVRGNDVRFNTGGLQIDGSSRNVIEANDASETSGIGIEIGGGSFENLVLANVANGNASSGIVVADDAADPFGVPVPGLGNVLVGNVAEGNRSDGIVVSKGGHTITANAAPDNAGLGINAATNSLDGGLNVASGNGKPEQCVGVVCKLEWNPPETAITSAPPDATAGSSARFLFSGSDDTTAAGALRFECRLDGAADAGWASCASPRSYAGLSAGQHVFEVRAVDGLDNRDATPARHVWTVDATPPETTIESGPDEETSGTVATFVFGADEPGATFACSLDGGPYESCASPAVYAGLGAGPHEFRVFATDAAGNSDPTSASRSWSVDATPPETVLGAAPPTPTASTSATFAFSADEPGAAFSCSLDGAPFDACSSPVEYSGLPDGGHTFEVRASDPVGNVDPSPAAHTWVVDTVAPETAVVAAPPALTSQAFASFSFGSEVRAAFECRLDGGAWETCESPQDYAALADGVHVFEVRARDAAGNVDASPAAYSWMVDRLAPETAIESGPPALTSAAGASFSFRSEPGAAFECRLDGGAWQSCESPQDYAALADGAHLFEVRARDAAGNMEPSPAAHAWTIDTVAPETGIDSSPAALSNASTASFAFGSEAGASLECRLDGGDWAGCESPKSYAALAEGEHAFEVRGRDAAGNADASPASWRWVVDTVAPETAIESGPAALTNASSASFAFASEPGAAFECRLDGADWGPCESPKGYGPLAEGGHVFEVRATDAAGNVEASPALHGWRVDTLAPETSIDAGPPPLTSSAAASFAFGSEAGASFECRLDGGAWAGCESPRAYAALAEGGHVFEVRATDAAGNVDASPASRSWTVDTVAPETTIVSGPAALTNGTGASFAFSSSEAGSFECSLDNGAFAPCSSPQAYAGLAAGAHSFRVRATDAAGNVDATPAAFAWTVDTAAPQTSIDSGPPATTTSTSATFSFSANEPGSTFQCALDGAAFAACSSPHVYAVLALGGHSLQVRATDPAGNTDPTPAAFSWTIATSGSCVSSTVTLGAAADAWVLQTSPTSNYGGDSVLKVDTKLGANARALVRFALPPMPAGCQVADARLRLYAASYKTGRMVDVVRLAAPWTESAVTWSNQPATAGAAATVASGEGYREWNALAQVQAMYASGNHGFLVRDASEGGSGWEQGFHSREKGSDNPPRLVLTFASPSPTAALSSGR